MKIADVILYSKILFERLFCTI